MGLELQIKQSQALSERMIQSVKILQMTTQELESYINDLALENPAMEVTEHPKESIEEQRWSRFSQEDYYYRRQRHNNDDEFDPKSSWNIEGDTGETLYDFLWSQIMTEPLTQMEKNIIDFMLKSLDKKGYLTESVENIARWFQADEAVVAAVLERLQALDPPGVCARSLQECLLLQLKTQGLLDPNLCRMIDECLELIAKSKFSAIAHKLKISRAQVNRYCQIIRSLNPKPGSPFYHHERVTYVIPDIIIVRDGDSFNILLNDVMVPKISVDNYYKKLNQESGSEEVKEYLEKKIKQVEWVRQCIAQRGRTMMAVSKEILKSQQDFFLQGPECLRPLRLADIAETIQVHESTVSRAVDNKFLQCSWGVYPLSFFFQRNAAAHTGIFSVGDGQPYTNAAIKRAIHEIIGGEDRKKPYSDQTLSELLKERGISISRRTVAKYREEEGIPDTRGRKYYE